MARILLKQVTQSMLADLMQRARAKGDEQTVADCIEFSDRLAEGRFIGKNIKACRRVSKELNRCPICFGKAEAAE